LKEKTQVFLYDEGDHYRTRLTHTLEVAQIARSLARALHLDEDLAETLALAHDLGHPPFGHAGERALDAAMRDVGGFDHNAQSLRVVTALERRYPRFDGLNLTWETLEGLVKHNGPLVDRDGRPIGPYAAKGLPTAIAEYASVQDLWLWSHAGAEAQCAAIADDIAYDAHDLDDGLRSGVLSLEAIWDTDLISPILNEIRRQFPGLQRERMIHELVRRLIASMVEDVVSESSRRLRATKPESADAIRKAGRQLIGFSPPMAQAERGIKEWLGERLYRSPPVTAVMEKAEGIVRRLYDRYRQDPGAMPEDWRPASDLDDGARTRRIGDFLAGMTDRYAIREYRRLFDESPDFG
jgi:dGTPase